MLAAATAASREAVLKSGMVLIVAWFFYEMVRMRRFFFCWVLVWASLAMAQAAPAAAKLATPRLQVRAVKISDGDTLWVQTKAGARLKIRLAQIDAPEICQAWGQQSKRALAQKITGRSLQLELLGQDQYTRGLARIWVDGQDVGAWMVASGHAWAYSLGKYQNALYYRQEEAAKKAQLGLWTLPAPMQPRFFRRQQPSCHPDWKPKAQAA